jgi:hypothetical protein
MKSHGFSTRARAPPLRERGAGEPLRSYPRIEKDKKWFRVLGSIAPFTKTAPACATSPGQLRRRASAAIIYRQRERYRR